MGEALGKQKKWARERRLAIKLWVEGIEHPLSPDVLWAILAEVGPEPVGVEFKEKLPWIRKLSAAVRREKFRQTLSREVVSVFEAEVDTELRRSTVRWRENRPTFEHGGDMHSENQIDLDVALRKIHELALADGDLGFEYWNQIGQLLRRAGGMQAEIDILSNDLERCRAARRLRK